MDLCLNKYFYKRYTMHKFNFVKTSITIKYSYHSPNVIMKNNELFIHTLINN